MQIQAALVVIFLHVKAGSQQTFQPYGRSGYITACLESRQIKCMATCKDWKEFGEIKMVKNKLFPVHLCLHILLIQT